MAASPQPLFAFYSMASAFFSFDSLYLLLMRRLECLHSVDSEHCASMIACYLRFFESIGVNLANRSQASARVEPEDSSKS